MNSDDEEKDRDEKNALSDMKKNMEKFRMKMIEKGWVSIEAEVKYERASGWGRFTQMRIEEDKMKKTTVT